jgi:hypothetical protein
MRRHPEILAAMLLLASTTVAPAQEPPADVTAEAVPFGKQRLPVRECHEGENIGREIGSTAPSRGVRATRCGVPTGTSVPPNQGQIDAAIVTETQGAVSVGTATPRGR